MIESESLTCSSAVVTANASVRPGQNRLTCILRIVVFIVSMYPKNMYFNDENGITDLQQCLFLPMSYYVTLKIVDR